MANQTIDTEPEVHHLTDAEAHAIFDNAARRYMHMSGEEFLRAWNEGRFCDCDCTGPVAWVTMLIPLVQPT